MNKIIFTLIIYFPFAVFAQTVTFSGKIIDKSNNKGLPFANIRVVDNYYGTASNSVGEFQIKLPKGNYTFVSSYIGFKSDTLSARLTGDKTIKIFLSPRIVELPQVTVTPGINPALKIIEKAIDAKHERNKKLNSYSFTAYTKGFIKTTKEISSKGKNVGISIGESDSSKLKITGIIENVSRGYFRKPDDYKEEIVAQKQSSNLSSRINVVTGGRIIQDFYGNDIEFFGRPLPSPIADNALDYYYYYIEDKLAYDNKTVYQIYFAPEDEYYPGFKGRIFIADSTYDLLKVDLNLNRAANPGQIFTKLNIFQQFFPFDGIYMPVDYRLFVEGNALGLMKFGFEVNSILYDFKINRKFGDDFFDWVVLKVKPEADKKDSSYWKGIQTIPSTDEEIKAYARIDSIESVPVTFWDRFSFLSMNIRLTKNLSSSGTMNLYSFNKVEGHTLNFGLYGRRYFNKRFDADFEIDYGFGDKKFKSEFSSSFLIGEYRTHKISFYIYNKLETLFGETDYYNKLTSTLLSLFSKYDFRDYYYTKGFQLKYKGGVLPFLNLSAGIANRTDNSAVNNSDFSFFYRNRTYKPNQPVYETRVNSVSLGFELDFRKFMENGYFRIRISRSRNYILFGGGVLISDKNILNSSSDFQLYNLKAYASLATFKSAYLSLQIKGIRGSGEIPFQMLYALPGNINAAAKDFSFRTLRFGEMFGDKVLTINLEHKFNDELFILSGIPIIKDLQLLLSVHAAAAWLEISPESKSILPVNYTEFKKPFFEAGFSIGQTLLPMTFDFTWKLNYRGRNNFVIGINSFAL